MRSRVSNGSDILPNIDGRSVKARRIYDIASAIANDLGGADKLTETRISLIRRFASLAAIAEEQEARVANGEEIDVGKLAKISSTLVRLATRIGLKRVPKNVTPVLHDYLEASDGEEHPAGDA
jgi:hypothetical protein